MRVNRAPALDGVTPYLKIFPYPLSSPLFGILKTLFQQGFTIFCLRETYEIEL